MSDPIRDPLTTISALRRLAIGGLCERDAETRAVAERLLSFVEGGDASLDDALGLTTRRGEPGWRMQRARQERNRYLRLAALVFCPNMPPPESARTIAAAWQEYVSSPHWQRDRACISCPANIRATIREPIWHAAQAWPGPPLTAKAICEVIRDTSEFRSRLNFQRQAQ